MNDKAMRTFAELTGMSPSQLRQPASRELLGQVVDKSSEAIRLLSKRFAELEQRMASVESKGLEYKGIYSRAVTYRKGSVVTRSGSLWISCKETSDTPGKSDAWQLISKGK